MLASNINVRQKPSTLLKKKKEKQNKPEKVVMLLRVAFRIIIFEMSLAKLRKISYTRRQRNQIPQKKSAQVTKPSSRGLSDFLHSNKITI